MTSKQSNKRNRTTSDDADFKPPAIEKKQKRTSPSDVESIVSPSRRPSKPKGAPKTSKALQKTWKHWCIEHHWISEQNPGYKQAIGSTEVHKSDAMKYFGLKGWEMDTLPHITFDNTYSLGAPHGRSYNYENVRKLVARKRSFLAGFEESLDLTTLAGDFFKRGWELEEDRLRELEDKYKKRNDRPRPALRKWYISERHPPPTYPSGLRECACCAFFGISDQYDC